MKKKRNNSMPRNAYSQQQDIDHQFYSKNENNKYNY